jgi:Fic family protein
VREGIPVLVQSAMLHYQFEAIHPFSDGNGRVGRLLITLFLCERERLRKPLLYLSEYFDQHRTEYYDRLLAVSRDGDWHGWIVFFLKGVASQANAAVTHAHKILGLRDEYRKRLHGIKAPGTTLAALDVVFRRPFVTIPLVAQRTKTTYPTAKEIVKRLEEIGVLTRFDPGQNWRRIYYAQELVRLLEE